MVDYLYLFSLLALVPSLTYPNLSPTRVPPQLQLDQDEKILWRKDWNPEGFENQIDNARVLFGCESRSPAHGRFKKYRSGRCVLEKLKSRLAFP